MSTPFDTTTVRGFSNEPAATDAQIGFLRSLMMEKAIKQGVEVELATTLVNDWFSRGVSKAKASENITRLKGEGFTGYRSPAAKADTATVSAEVVPAGRYAVETEDGATNGLAFYRVDRPTEGRWAGYVFVKLIVSDDEQRLSQKAGQAVLAKIAEAGAEAASARYGHEIGECGICGRTLTSDASREIGIGPICKAKVGW